jgi:hypothetical protein
MPKPRKPATPALPVPADLPPPAGADLPPLAAPAIVPRNVARAIARIAAAIYPFANFSDRDASYLALYTLCAIRTGGVFDASHLLASAGPDRRNPFAPGIASAGAADAGANRRMRAAGYIVSTDASDTAFVLASVPPPAIGEPVHITDARNRLASAEAAARAYLARLG